MRRKNKTKYLHGAMELITQNTKQGKQKEICDKASKKKTCSN